MEARHTSQTPKLTLRNLKVITFAAIIKERCALEPEQLRPSELARRSDEAIIWFTHMCAYGTIKRMSFAIGHHQLADTYERVLIRETPLLASLISR